MIKRINKVVFVENIHYQCLIITQWVCFFSLISFIQYTFQFDIINVVYQNILTATLIAYLRI